MRSGETGVHCWFFPVIFVFFVPSSFSLCPDTPTCISRLRMITSDPKHFWFGSQRHALCENTQSASCWSPPSLVHFHQLGQRLFRVNTYHTAYLRNLLIFPRIVFRPSPGSYRACDHDFLVENASLIECDPDMQPVEPFLLRRKPEIAWSGLEQTDRYTLVLTDAGFGTLNYLVEDFPAKIKIHKEYTVSNNFRPLANPMVLLVFKKPNQPLVLPDDEENFILSDFMSANELEDGLVGMSLVMVGSDAFGIERQRLKGGPDNCNSLLKYKIYRDPPSRILPRLPLHELSVWMSISYRQPEFHATVCCQEVHLREEWIMVDPLGNRTLSVLAVKDPPVISSLVSPVLPSLYHRSARTFVALSDDLYSLALVDGSSGVLHWLLVDVPSSVLASDANIGGVEKAKYVPPVMERAGSCGFFVFFLFLQRRSLSSVPVFCPNRLCHERNTFRLETFKQRHELRMVGTSWVNVCYDLPYAHEALRYHEHMNNGSNKVSHPSSLDVCAAFHVDSSRRCTSQVHLLVSSSPSSLFFIFYFLLLIYRLPYIVVLHI